MSQIYRCKVKLLTTVIFWNLILNFFYLKATRDRIEIKHASYVTQNDDELFVCKSLNYEQRWYKKEDIPTEMLDNFRKFKNSLNNPSCNTDKTNTFSCGLKCKTRGLQLACSNCGIIIGFRELYGSESLTQVALMALEIYESFTRTRNISIALMALEI